jgi:hypothetical protein
MIAPRSIARGKSRGSDASGFASPPALISFENSNSYKSKLARRNADPTPATINLREWGQHFCIASHKNQEKTPQRNECGGVRGSALMKNKLNSDSEFLFFSKTKTQTETKTFLRRPWGFNYR